MTKVFIQDCRAQNEAVDIGEIELHVQSMLHGRVGDLHLRTCGKGVVLQGHAPTYYAKQVAQHAVMETTTLPILRNEIEVEGDGAT